MAWLSGWKKRVKITIDHNDIDAALSHFPVLLHLSSNCGRNSDDVTFVFDELQSDANRKKIAVTEADGETQLYVEIEKWDDANEEAWLWVSKTGWEISSTSDTDLYLYFDSSHADNTTYVGDTDDVVAENVWDSYFKAVHHLRDATTSTVKDSTGNDNDGTKLAANEPIETDAGKIDGAQVFDGGDDEIELASQIGQTTELTVEAWTSRDVEDVLHHIISEGRLANGFGGFGLFVNTNNVIWFAVDDGSSRETAFKDYPADTNLHYIAGTYKGGDASFVYVDGVAGDENDCSEHSQMAAPTYDLFIGKEGYDARYWWDGKIDEVRISTVERSSAWIKATYETTRDNLLDWGSEEEGTRYPGTISTLSVVPEDDNDWDNPSNIGANDGQYAEVTHATFDAGDITYRLKAQNFGFTIPEGSSILGIKVEIERYNDAGETAKDYRVQLLNADGSLVGDNKADTVNPWPTTPTIKSYGGATDTWNINPTRDMVNDADWGVVLSAEAIDDNADIYVDFIRITVYYSAYAHYYRTYTALLGLLGSGSRGLDLARADTGLLGLLASGSRGLDLARGGTALLGLKATATRAVNYTRTKMALLGLKTTATRSIAITRSKTALLGLLATGSRAIDIARSETALLGLKAIGIMSTAKHYYRTGIAYLGLLAIGTRSIALARTKTASLGLKGIGSRAISLSRADVALLGLKATGVMSTFKHYIRTGVAYLGLVVTGSRSIALSRISTALLGLKGIASRTIAIGRSGTALLGLKGIASKVISYVQAYVALRRAYVVELRNGDGDLVAILENARGINYSQIINGPYYLSFEIPSDDSKASNIILANEIWLRDTRTNTVVRKFRLQKTTEVRS